MPYFLRNILAFFKSSSYSSRGVPLLVIYAKKEELSLCKEGMYGVLVLRKIRKKERFCSLVSVLARSRMH